MKKILTIFILSLLSVSVNADSWAWDSEVELSTPKEVVEVADSWTWDDNSPAILEYNEEHSEEHSWSWE
jgi:hypothetical protein